MPEQVEIEAGLTGAVLAGGKSRRMGRDKALLELGDQTLIERAVALLQNCIERPMIITDRPGKYAFLGLPCHADLVPRIGPLGGIYTALVHADRSHCLVLACDLPFVTPEIIAVLSDRALEYDVVAVDAGNGVEPLCAVYSRACLPAIQRRLAQQRYKVTDFYPQVDVTVVELQQVVPELHGETFLNLNTPEDLAQARERLRKP